MIVTELTDQVELEMDALVRQGVTSFKLFMAYPGVFMLDDASIFKALQRTGKNGGTICMHAENGGVIDVLVKQALAEGKTAPKYHALTRPARAEAEATHRAIALAEIADLPRRSRWSRRRAIGACRRLRRPARSTCSCRTTTTKSRDSTVPST
jgi:dihydropyrimidinase